MVLTLAARRAPGSSSRDVIAGRLTEYSQHSVCKSAPIRDRVGHSIGRLEGWVEVFDYLGGTVGSGNATQSSPVSKMCLCPLDPIRQTLIQCGVR
jgi:hypothetical protein